MRLTVANKSKLSGAGVESPRRILKELLLPGVNLVGMNFVALRQIGDRRCFPHGLQGDLGLQACVDLASRLLRH